MLLLVKSGSGKNHIVKNNYGINTTEFWRGSLWKRKFKEHIKDFFKKSKLGVVTPKSQIFNTTIIDNIKMKRNISDNDLKKSIEITQC